MRLLVLAKRQYMGKDLLDDRFGRFRELPLGLAQLGHNVQGLALSYRRRAEGVTRDSVESNHAGVSWHSINLINGLAPRLRRYVRRAKELAKDFKPDVIWAGSDAYHAIFGAWLGKQIGVRSVIDLYDNFEAFGASKMPGILPLFRRAVKEAHGITCFSQRLADHVVQPYGRTKPTSVIENGIRKDLFYPEERDACRQRLGLPADAQIIGTAGALHSSRGIDTLFQAFELLAPKNRNLHLALAGPRERGLRIPTGPRVHDLGALPHENVPYFINALDLAVICYRQSAQGEFSFPQKAYEIIACRTAFIAAAVGSMNELLRDHPGYLYEPENAQSLADAAQRQLKNKIILETQIPSWADSAKQLERFFESIVKADSSGLGTQPFTAIAR